MSKALLKKRWQDFKNLQEILSATQNLQKSPFGLTDQELQDFRGISLLTSPIEVGGGWDNQPHQISIEKSDFSYSDWKGFDIVDSTIENTNFFKANFENTIVFYKTQFKKVTFNECKFKRIYFSKASLLETGFSKIKAGDKISFDAEKIDNCSFEGEMKGLNFNCSPIKNSKFIGSLTDCTFKGRPSAISLKENPDLYLELEPSQVHNRMDGVDFSKASLIMCNFSTYCHLDLTIPPDDSKNCFARLNEDFFNECIRIMKQQCAPELLNKTTDWFNTFFKPDPRTPYGVLGPEDFVKALTPKGSSDFYKAFLQAAINTGTKV